MKPLLTLAVVLSVGSISHAGELHGVLENNRGVAKFKAEKPVEAFDKFTSALGDLPFSGEVHYNLGTAFLQNQEFDKALSEYREAIRNAPGNSGRDHRTRFFSHFNSAVALTDLKRVDEALLEYQLALEENPDSVETKTNIELLTKSQSGGGEGDDQKQDDKGKGDNKQQNQKQDQKGKDPKKDQNQQQQPQDQKPKEKPTPRPFKSEELSQQDVGKILDELKRQEEQIRARMQNEKVKDAPPDKDW